MFNKSQPYTAMAITVFTFKKRKNLMLCLNFVGKECPPRYVVGHV